MTLAGLDGVLMRGFPSAQVLRRELASSDSRKSFFFPLFFFFSRLLDYNTLSYYLLPRGNVNKMTIAQGEVGISWTPAEYELIDFGTRERERSESR